MPTQSAITSATAPTSSAISTLLELRTTPSTPRQNRLRASSRDAYARDVELFIRFGGTIPSTPQDLEAYIDKMRTKVAPPTIYRRLHAIAHQHRTQGHPSPIDDRLRALMQWLQKGKLPPKGKQVPPPPPESKRAGRSAKPMTRQLLSRLVDAVLRTSLDRRDEAVILLGFMGALKRGQLVAIDVKDCTWTNDALLVRIKSEVEDVESNPQPARTIAIPITGGELCAASSVRRAVDHLALTPDSPLFVSFNRAGDPTNRRLAAAFVSEVVKRRLAVVGIDPKAYSGESLRRGRLLEIAKGAPV